MTRDDVERELREKLSGFTFQHQFSLWRIPPAILNKMVAALLPWVMEVREDAAMQARIDDGQLP